MIKLTNTGTLAGNSLWVNPAHIIAVYEIPTEGGSLTTRVWGGTPAVEWVVEESMSEVIKMIGKENASKGCGCH